MTGVMNDKRWNSRLLQNHKQPHPHLPLLHNYIYYMISHTSQESVLKLKG